MTDGIAMWHRHFLGRKGEPWEVTLVLWDYDGTRKHHRVRFRYVVEDVEWTGHRVPDEP